MKIVQPEVKLVWITPNAAQIIEMAARKCYASEDQYDPDHSADFLDRVVHQRHHTSVTEHASACFDVTTDRGVMAEFTRHRHASFSVESTRFCAYNKGKFGGQISVVEPPNLNTEQYLMWSRNVESAEKTYMQLLSSGVKPEIARSVLPMCLATHMRVTANFNSWRHIISLRTGKSAHPQIREVVCVIQDVLAHHVPELFGHDEAPNL